MKRRVVAMVATVALLASVVASTAVAIEPVDFAATPIAPDETLEVPKALSSRLAQSDPELLARTDAELINVLVKLDVDAAASYAGGVPGLEATSPQATGRKLKANKAAVDAYLKHVERFEAEVLGRVMSIVPDAHVVASYRAVYGGVAMQIPANQAKVLAQVEGVVAVQFDRLEQPLTDVTPDFVGASAVWPSLGGSSTAGEGVIVGVLDTGIWPEHPSFADPGIDHPGGTYGCQFGDGSDPDLGPTFTCNDKLIGAYAFVNTYLAFGPAVLPGEFCNATETQCSARDANGHGTHTSSTAAGSPVASASLFGVERGPISGIAPGAHVIMYRVCLDAGCFGSDSVAAVNQAILDGVDVLNFSISGGTSAYTDAVELAFLDAYAADVLVNASAGNNGPGAATANHAGPWTNTVAASTSNRHFLSQLTLTAANGDTYNATGATVTDGIVTPTPIVRAGAIAGYADELCRTPLPAGSAAGQVVLCRRGVIARVEKSYNVSTGGAVGMILYNPILQGLNTDNHFVPSIHLDGPPTDLLAFLTGHTGIVASWTAGVKTTVPGDVMASFSSRGPLGDFLKPDVTAPGVQILAGNTPQPATVESGLPGEIFQAIQGTSMSSPHAAGVAALVKASHPDWTPGQIKSALMTSSVQGVLKEDGVTPSSPFDRGAGSIRADRAVAPVLTFDVPAATYYASAADPLGRVNLNLPSVNVADFAGSLTTTRTVTNVSGASQTIEVLTSAPVGAAISVTPSKFDIGPGASQILTIGISGTTIANGQYFGQITLDPKKAGYNDVVMPVAFRKVADAPGISITHSCSPTTISVGGSASCTVSASNLSPVVADATIQVQGPTSSRDLRIENVSAPATKAGNGALWSGTLSAAFAPTVDAIVPSTDSPAGFLPLSLFGVAPIGGVGDETIANFNVPAFKFGTETYTRIGLVANGYAVVGGGSSADVLFDPSPFPNVARPNNVLAPFWTDLNPAAGGALRIAILTEGVTTWLVAEWAGVPTFGTSQLQSFQIWIQLGATEAIWYTYGTVTGSGSPEGLTVGAENRDGTSGVNLGSVPVSGSEYKILTSGPTPGGSVSFTYEALGRRVGAYQVSANLTSNVSVGVSTKVVSLTVE